MRPNFEEPLDTAKQLVERNITLYDVPGAEYWKQFLLESTILEYNILAENYIVADNMEHFYHKAEHDVIGAGTHAVMAAHLLSKELSLGGERGWYRSKESVAGINPYGGYLTNKKWHLNKVRRT